VICIKRSAIPFFLPRFTHIGLFPTYLTPLRVFMSTKVTCTFSYTALFLSLPYFIGLFHHSLACICYGNITVYEKCQRLLKSFTVAILSYCREFSFRDWGKSLNPWFSVACIRVQDKKTAPREHKTGMNEPYEQHWRPRRMRKDIIKMVL
jgi:hypothetical protein